MNVFQRERASERFTVNTVFKETDSVEYVFKADTAYVRIEIKSDLDM